MTLNVSIKNKDKLYEKFRDCVKEPEIIFYSKLR